MLTDIICIRWHPLDFFPSIFPVVTRCSNFFFLMACPINHACCVLILIIIFLLLLAVLRISSLFFCSVHETPIILLKNHILVASMRCCVCLFNADDSQPLYVIWAQCNTVIHVFSPHFHSNILFRGVYSHEALTKI